MKHEDIIVDDRIKDLLSSADKVNRYIGISILMYDNTIEDIVRVVLKDRLFYESTERYC